MTTPTSPFVPAFPSYTADPVSYSTAFPPLQSWSLPTPQTKKHGQTVHRFNTLHQSLAPPKYPPYLKKTKYAELALEHYNYLQSKRPFKYDNSGTQSAQFRQVPVCASANDIDLRLPTCWNQQDKSAYVEVGRNGLDLTYNGSLLTSKEPAAVRTNFPMRPQCGVYYFEIFICSKGTDGRIGVGFCTADNKLNRLPGWDKGSWGYHGDEGTAFSGFTSGKPFGSGFTTGDVIGCGVNFGDNSAFYTKNGAFLGVAFEDIRAKGPLYPCVGLMTEGEHIRVNFGQDPFVFDITHYIENCKAAVCDAVAHRSLPEEADLLNQLISTYLIHHGYTGTARAFAENVQRVSGKTLVLPESPDMNERQSIRTAILDGDIDLAMGLMEKHFPAVLQGNNDIAFQLKCRKFIEMVREHHEHEQRLMFKNESLTSEDDRMSICSNNAHADDVFDSDNRRRSLNSSLGSASTPSMHVPNAGPRRLSYAAIAAVASPSSSNGILAFSASPTEMDDEFMFGRRQRRMSNRRSSIGSNSIMSTGSTTIFSYEATLEEEEEEEEGDDQRGHEADAQGNPGVTMRHIIQYGKRLKAEYGDCHRPFVKSRLAEIFSLMAYPDLGTSPVAYLMDKSYRDDLATELNGAILEYQRKPTMAPFERIYRHAIATNKELAYDGHGKAALVDINRICNIKPAVTGG